MCLGLPEDTGARGDRGVGMSRQSFRRTRNVVVGAVVSVGIAAGTWAVVRASGSTGSREGASYNVIKKKVTYGSNCTMETY